MEGDEGIPPSVQRGGGRSRQPRRGCVSRLGVDAGGGDAGDALGPPERDLPRPGGRSGPDAPHRGNRLRPSGAQHDTPSGALSTAAPRLPEPPALLRLRSLRARTSSRPRVSRRRSCPGASRRLCRERGDAARPEREADAVGLRHDSHPPRNNVGDVLGSGRHLGQAAHRRAA